MLKAIRTGFWLAGRLRAWITARRRVHGVVEQVWLSLVLGSLVLVTVITVV